MSLLDAIGRATRTTVAIAFGLFALFFLVFFVGPILFVATWMTDGMDE